MGTMSNLVSIIVELLAYTAVRYCISIMYWRGIAPKIVEGQELG